MHRGIFVAQSAPAIRLACSTVLLHTVLSSEVYVTYVGVGNWPALDTPTGVTIERARRNLFWIDAEYLNVTPIIYILMVIRSHE